MHRAAPVRKKWIFIFSKKGQYTHVLEMKSKKLNQNLKLDQEDPPKYATKTSDVVIVRDQRMQCDKTHVMM